MSYQASKKLQVQPVGFRKKRRTTKVDTKSTDTDGTYLLTVYSVYNDILDVFFTYYLWKM